jgi:hypothetical protein
LPAQLTTDGRVQSSLGCRVDDVTAAKLYLALLAQATWPFENILSTVKIVSLKGRSPMNLFPFTHKQFLFDIVYY